MFSVSNILCDHAAGNEQLRYGHRDRGQQRSSEQVPRPVVVWAVTRRCNLRCVHCYASATADAEPDELTHEEGRELLRELSAFRVPAVLFSGGEPLARPDTLELMRYARSLGLPVTLSTNGLLIDKRTANELADIGVRYIGISLDGLQSVHDRLRGQRGAFAGSVEALRRCRRHGLKVGVRFTIHTLNAHHLDDVIDLCVAERIDRLCVYHLAYAGRGGRMSHHDLTADQTRAAVERLFTRTQQLHAQGTPLEVLTVGNHADAAYAVLRSEHTSPADTQRLFDRLARTGGNRSGQNICSISPTGNVHIDQFSWHLSVGNIRHQTFNEVWGADPADRRLRHLRQRVQLLPERCKRCRFIEVCNGNSRTRAHAATGSWAGQDPSCYLRDEEIASCGAAS